MRPDKTLPDYSWNGFRDAFEKNGFGSIIVPGIEPALYRSYWINQRASLGTTVRLSLYDPGPVFAKRQAPTVVLFVAYSKLISLNQEVFAGEMVDLAFIVEKVDRSMNCRHVLANEYLVRIGDAELRFE